MFPSAEWLRYWEATREQREAYADFNAYFSQPKLAGRELFVLDIGPCDLPTGRILVRDPLCYLQRREELPYFQHVPAGRYSAELCVVKPAEEGECARYAAARLRFSDAPAIRFDEALIGGEKLRDMKDGEYFGFNVDAGLACICDEAAHQAFCDFTQRWYKSHPDGNLYDDYFAALFKENAQRSPAYQRSGGDWLNWQIPRTDYHIPLFQSGFGDGAYPVYWGYDREGVICQLVIQFIDIPLAYGKPSDALSMDSFRHENGFSEGRIYLPEWDDRFGTASPYRLVLSLASCKDRLETLTSAQKAGYDYLVENQGKLADLILSALLKRYPDIQTEYGYEEDEKAGYMPDAADIDALAGLLTPLTIFLHPVVRDDLPYIGVEFDCTWDDEHGFGVMLYGDRVAELGGADTAILTWIARRDLEQWEKGPEALAQRLRRWHEAGEYAKIADAIRRLPPEERQLSLVIHWGQILSGEHRYDEALEILEAAGEEGRTDAIWNYCMGQIWSGDSEEDEDRLQRLEKALAYYDKAAELHPDDRDIQKSCRRCRVEISRMRSEEADAAPDCGIRIPPFRFVSGPVVSVVYLESGPYLQEVFGTRADQGFAGTGFDWASLARVFLDERRPSLKPKIHLEPEPELFAAWADKESDLQDFALSFHAACEDRSLILDLFSRAVPPADDGDGCIAP